MSTQAKSCACFTKINTLLFFGAINKAFKASINTKSVSFT